MVVMGSIGRITRADEWIPAFAGMTKQWIRLAVVALVIAVAGVPARADDFAAAAAGLAGASFAEKEKAIVALGRLGDPRAVPVLQALRDDRLRRAPDGRLVIVAAAGATAKPIDPASGQEIAGLAPDGLDRILVNNRLRGAIDAALGSLTLFSPDPAVRLAAAQEALKRPSAEAIAPLEKALAAEQDGEVRAAVEQSLAAARLFGGSSKEERLAAIRALADTTDPQIKNLLDEFRGKPDLDPELKKAAEHALVAIDHRLLLTGLAANLFQGVSLGSVLLLAAIGLAITFGVMGVINMAHGEMIM